jgi:hypothetical protein
MTVVGMGSCRQSQATSGANITNYYTVQSGNEAALKQAVYTQGPIIVAFHSNSYMHNYA